MDLNQPERLPRPFQQIVDNAVDAFAKSYKGLLQHQRRVDNLVQSDVFPRSIRFAASLFISEQLYQHLGREEANSLHEDFNATLMEAKVNLRNSIIDVAKLELDLSQRKTENITTSAVTDLTNLAVHILQQMGEPLSKKDIEDVLQPQQPSFTPPVFSNNSASTTTSSLTQRQIVMSVLHHNATRPNDDDDEDDDDDDDDEDNGDSDDANQRKRKKTQQQSIMSFQTQQHPSLTAAQDKIINNFLVPAIAATHQRTADVKFSINLNMASSSLQQMKMQQAKMEAATIIDDIPNPELVAELVDKKISATVGRLKNRIHNLERSSKNSMSSANNNNKGRTGQKQQSLQQQQRNNSNSNSNHNQRGRGRGQGRGRGRGSQAQSVDANSSNNKRGGNPNNSRGRGRGKGRSKGRGRSRGRGRGRGRN